MDISTYNIVIGLLLSALIAVMAFAGRLVYAKLCEVSTLLREVMKEFSGKVAAIDVRVVRIEATLWPHEGPHKANGDDRE